MPGKYNDDDSEDQPLMKQTGPSAQISKQVSSIQESFKQIDTQFKDLERQFTELKKATSPEQAKQISNRVTQILTAMQKQRFPSAQSSLQQFHKQIASAQISDSQKAEYYKSEQQFAQVLANKQSQLQNVQSHYQKLSQKIDDQTKDDPELDAKKFKMQLLEEEIEDQLDDIIKINQNVNDLGQMMKIMEVETLKCQETINIIEDNVAAADAKVAKGADNLQVARKTQKSKNKWLWIGLGITVAVAVILLLIFVL
ncbi:SNARE [Hexamita inflata]|uniref:SNARE n=1 Tax=Hexamita inflata TaxID=28002 RepID=A0AA86PR72_9EUKA|nr:SNARE [Hexamita inflata]